VARSEARGKKEFRPFGEVKQLSRRAATSSPELAQHIP
jgi:hypothetical protein